MPYSFLGQVSAFAFDFAPPGWAPCSGQLLPINQNTALFSIIGTYYGGNGTTNFALPNLTGRVPIGTGALSNPPSQVAIAGSQALQPISSIQWGGAAVGPVETLGLGYYVAFTGTDPVPSSATASTNNVGQITLFAGSFTPSGWFPCAGQSELINTATDALFGLFGNNYGGDGISNFTLPNLSSSVLMGIGANGI